jgi:acetyl-CoA acetyltransferase
MRDALIISAVRTPVGRAGGALADIRPDDLAAIAVRGAVDRVSSIPRASMTSFSGARIQAGEDNATSPGWRRCSPASLSKFPDRR